MKFKKIAAAVLAAVMLAATPATVGLFSPFSVTANAEDTLTEGDYEYSVNEDGESVTITKYTGSDTDSDFTIPSTLGGKTVTAIGDSAFSWCSSLTSVIIPNGVKTIGSECFAVCQSLTNITIPASVTSIGENCFLYCIRLDVIDVSPDNENYSFEGGVLFSKDKTELIKYLEGINLNSYTIPNGVTSIDECAFSCLSLEYITIPDSVTSLSSKCFINCDHLTAIDVSSDNENYSSESGVLFNKDKTELIKYPEDKNSKSYTIPESVTHIGEHAFYHAKFSSVTLPDCVTSIGDSAFYSCIYLTSVTMPNRVTSIGDFAFHYCQELTSITIPDSAERIGENAFGYCESLSSVRLPDSITKIEPDTFLFCKSLDSIEIPEGVTSIGDSAFSCCEKLTTAIIPESVKYIGRCTFNTISIKDVFYGGSESQWKKIDIDETNKLNSDIANAIIHFAKEDEEEHETSEPTESDTSEPTSSDTSEPTTSDTSEPTSSDTSEPTSSDTSEPTSSDTSEPTSSDTSEPTSSDTSEPTSSDTSDPTSSDTSSPDNSGEENEVSANVEPSPDAAGIPEDDRIPSVTINAFNMKYKGELDLSKVEVKAREIYDAESLKRVEEALGIKINENKSYNLLDLTLLYDGKDISGDYEGLVQVIIPLPAGHRDKTFSCFRMTEVNGKMIKEVIPGTQTEDSYIIYLEHFSLYALVADGGETPTESETESSDVTDTTTSETTDVSDTTSGNDQQPTGIAIAIAPVALAVGTVIVFSKKKK